MHYKVGKGDETQPQMAVLYPKRQGGDVVRGVLKAHYLDEVVIVLEPHPENSSRNVVTNVIPVVVPA